MNANDLLNAMAKTEEKYISEAENISAVAGEFRKQKNKKIKAALSALGCLCFAVAAALVPQLIDAKHALPENPSANSVPEELPEYTQSASGVSEMPSDSAPGKKEPDTTVSDAAVQSTQSGGEATTNAAVSATQEAEIAIIPKWGDRTRLDRFAEIGFNGARYFVSGGETGAEIFGEPLGTTKATGYDVYTDTEFSEEVLVFALQGVCEQCAVGVRFSDGVCAAYLNADYSPATLGQLIDDLGLKKNLTLGKAFASYFDSEKQYHSVTFNDFDDRLAWELPLSETAAENNTGYNGFSHTLADVSVSIHALGIVNKGLWVTEDGYLCTNILGSGYYFFIGAEKARAFEKALYDSVPFTDEIPDFSENAVGVPE